MSTSLYELSISCYLQGMGGVGAVLNKTLEHCDANDLEPAQMLEERLADDMWPLHYQLNSVAHHSMGAIKALQSGEFAPPQAPPELDFAGWQQHLTETGAALAAFSREQIDSYAGKTIVFRLGDNKIPFAAEDFILSFSLPNFHFHAATSYDILRARGVQLSKRHYMGRLKTLAQ